MGNYKYCKFCGSENGNCLTECKHCNNDKFWTRPNPPLRNPDEFTMQRKK